MKEKIIEKLNGSQLNEWACTALYEAGRIDQHDDMLKKLSEEVIEALEEDYVLVHKSEIVVLEDDAEPEVDDIVEVNKHPMIPNKVGYIDRIVDYHGKVYYVKSDNMDKAIDVRLGLEIIQRNNKPTIQRSKLGE